MGRGFILLHRCLEDDDLWLLEPFTKAQAWIDLLLLASHCEFTFEIRGNKVKVGRGQLARSERFFQDRWQWSRQKVRAFFLYLREDQKIVQQKSRIITITTIVCYDEYQNMGQQKVQQKDHRKTTENTTESTTFNTQEDTKHTKENKKENKKEKDFVLPDWVPVDAWNGYMEVRKKNKYPLTTRAMNLLIGKLEEFRAKGYDIQAIIDESTTRGWRSVFTGDDDSGKKTNKSRRQYSLKL